jgi:hypothetical protein
MDGDVSRSVASRRFLATLKTEQGAMSEHKFKDTNRHLVEVPDSFAVARWPRDADVATIARCILGTLRYEPHICDTAVLRRALEGVIEQAKDQAGAWVAFRCLQPSQRA